MCVRVGLVRGEEGGDAGEGSEDIERRGGGERVVAGEGVVEAVEDGERDGGAEGLGEEPRGGDGEEGEREANDDLDEGAGEGEGWAWCGATRRR